MIDMTCRKWNDAIPRYLDDELGSGEHHRFETHAEGCDRCASYLASYRRTMRLAREAFAEIEDDAADASWITGLVNTALEARRTRG